tara:strand:+ start:5477 stop:7636 length:2160 start_codon:yes stop_codon:yes gene_type:complete
LNILLLLLLLNPLFSNNYNYLWPTDNENSLTTTFGEPRTERFHAGIDVRTYGQIDKKLYAIESGHISRIRISSNNYGKAIYLKLNDGNTVLYSHLNKFNEEIEKIIDTLYQKYDNSFFDHTFKKNQSIQISRGEIIGYTGDTGSLSGPHLHFEIRDKNNNPTNPLIYYSDFKDGVKPIAKSLAIIPLKKDTWINGIQDYEIIDLKKISDFKYIIDDTISVIGEFGLAVETFDKINNSTFKFGIHKIELIIDNNILYNIEFDQYQFNQDKLIYKEMDYYLLNNKKSYHRLFNNSNKKLDFIKKDCTGITLDENYHNVIINIYDFHNNNIQIQAIMLGKMLINDTEITYNKNDEIKFKNTKSDITTNLISKYNDSRISIKQKQKNIFDVSAMTENYNIIEYYVSNELGISSKKEYFTLNKLNPYLINGDFLIKHIDAGIIIEFIEEIYSGYSPKMILTSDYYENLNLDLYRKDKNILSTKIISPIDIEKYNKIILKYSNQNPDIIFEKDLKGYNPKNKNNYCFKKICLNSDSTSFYNDTYIWIDETEIKIEKEYNVISGPIIINPKSIPFKNKISIDTELDYKNSAIYQYIEKNNTWKILDNKSNNNIKSNISSGGIFAILEEKEIPLIKNIEPKINGKYKLKNLKKITFNIIDRLSGINQNDISILLNSEKIYFNYIRYRDLIEANINEKLKLGKNHLKIEVKDKVGNLNIINGEFIIIE